MSIILRQSINRRLGLWNETIKAHAHRGEAFVGSLIRARNRWRARNDLFFLCRVTGNDKICQYPEYYEPFCDEVSLILWQVVKLGIHPGNEDLLPLDEVSDNPDEDFRYTQRLYECFRTFWKTTIISKVNSAQILLNFNNIHMVLCHNKQDNSSSNLIAIKNYFLTTDLRYWFAECVPNTKDWGNMHGFSLNNRTDWGRSEHNIEAVGVDTKVTGRHWQIAKKNDLVTEESVTTKEQIEKTKSWDDMFNIGLFDNPANPLQDYEGTRYHYSDLYSVKEGDPRIKLIKVPIISNKDDNTSITVKGRFTPDGIAGLKSDMWKFMCQMMLSPESPDKQQFSKEMIVYYEYLPAGLKFYLCVDPASTRKKKSDFTVMSVIGVSWDNKRYIADVIRDKLDPKKRVDAAMELIQKWDIMDIGWEANNFQNTDCFYLEEERRRLNLFFNVTEIISNFISKDDHIRSLIPEYSQHNWLWPPKGKMIRYCTFSGKNYDVTEEMEEEIVRWPLAAHDDLLDTQTFLKRMNVIIPQKKEEVRPCEGMTFGEYANLREERLRAFRRDPLKRLISRSYN